MNGRGAPIPPNHTIPMKGHRVYTANLLWLDACRLTVVRMLREELQLLQEPGSYVGEVVRLMGKKKVLVKVQPEGKYGKSRVRYLP